MTQKLNLQEQNQNKIKQARTVPVAKTPEQKCLKIIETLENFESKAEDKYFENYAKNTLIAVKTIENKIVTTFDELDGQILSMMNHSRGFWSCIRCGKAEKKKDHLRNHIERMHIDGIYHPCNQ